MSVERAVFVRRIREAWSASVAGVVGVGRVLVEAKENLPGEFGVMIERDLPFGQRTAQMLMAIGRHAVLSDPNHGSRLPSSWRTLYELSRVEPDRLLAAIESRRVHPEMHQFEARMLSGDTKAKARSGRGSASDASLKEPTGDDEDGDGDGEGDGEEPMQEQGA